MSSSTLIMGHPHDAVRMARAKTLRKWPNLELDPVEAVGLAKLCAFATGDKYDDVIGSFVDQTPPQPEVEPWDFENLINPVLLIPERYVRALAEVEDEQIPSLAERWYTSHGGEREQKFLYGGDIEGQNKRIQLWQLQWLKRQGIYPKRNAGPFTTGPGSCARYWPRAEERGYSK